MAQLSVIGATLVQFIYLLLLLLGKLFPLQGERAHSFLYVRMLGFKNKIEGERGDRTTTDLLIYHKVITFSAYYMYTTSPYTISYTINTHLSACHHLHKEECKTASKDPQHANTILLGRILAVPPFYHALFRSYKNFMFSLFPQLPVFSSIASFSLCLILFDFC